MMPIMPFDSTTVPLERGTTLIEASAGTGKTFSIAALYLRFVLEQHLPVQKILAVTYTVAATQELRDRVRKRMREALTSLRACEGEGGSDPVVAEFLRNGGDVRRAVRELDLAVQSFDEAPIFTIHGFCQRALQDHAFESGSRYSAETLSDAASLLGEVAADFWRRTFHQASPFLAALALAGAYSDCTDPEPWLSLLQRTRNHPNLVLLPGPDAETAACLAVKAEECLGQLCLVWLADKAGISAILREDKALSRDAKKGLGSDRVERGLAAVAALASGGAIVSADLDSLVFFRRRFIENCTKKNKVAPVHPFFDQCEAFCETVERYFLQLHHEFLAYAGEELALRKKQRNILTFDDLLTRLHDALAGGHGEAVAASLGGKYEVALIDEFQDTDPLQAAIFQRIFADGKHWLFLIGDPKQAIYGFRGADVFAYLEAATSASRHYGLEVNWRSDASLLAGFNALFQQVNDPFVIEKIDYVPVKVSPEKEDTSKEAPLVFRHLAAAEGEKALNKERAQEGILEAVVADIEAYREQFELNEMAVLVRKGRQAKSVQDALRDRGLPAVLYTEESVFQTPEAEVMQRFLEAVADPKGGMGGSRMKAALATPLFGCDANAIAALETDGEQWLERFLDWRVLWEQDGFVAMFRRVLTGEGVRRRLVELPGGERRLTNILHLAELLHGEETTRRLGPEALCGWLWEQRTAGRAASEAAQLRLESDAKAVSIVTIHKSKGLEYPVVFCPFLWEPAEPAKADTLCFHDDEGRITLDLRGKGGGLPEHVARAEEETLAEEVRLLYVAVTRAKHRCFVYSADYRDIVKSPLARLFPDRKVREGIEALACSDPAAMQFSPIEPLANAPASQSATSLEIAAAEPRQFKGFLTRAAFITSFTGLTAGTTREEAERDHPVEEESGVLLGRGEGPVHGIHLFDKGARAGDFFHEVLEHLDFRNPSELEMLVPEALAVHGFAHTPHEAAVKEKLREVLEVELERGLTLGQVAREDRLSEVDFACRLPSLRPEDLRHLFAGRGVPALDAAELGRFQFSPVAGFLRGAIDLFFRHGGRYYLLDWKSNWLGAAPEDYDAPGVERAMRSHHYALQAHLYVLAADRYLQARLPGYDYERHFGGIFYLFLRGVERENPNRGIYRIRPDLELVAAMRKLTEGGI